MKLLFYDFFLNSKPQSKKEELAQPFKKIFDSYISYRNVMRGDFL